MRACLFSLAIIFSANASARELRVCADPNNLPFSNARGEGFENALAKLVARALERTLVYTWQPQRRGFVRQTLKASRCDVMMEAPVGYDRVAVTLPYYRSSYVFVSRRDRHLDVRSFDAPLLQKLRIGIQTVGDDYANTPPAEALARRGLIKSVVGYPVFGNYSSAVPQQPILDAVERGDVDVAIVWGPLAGWFAKRARVPLVIAPVDPAVRPFVFDIGMGVRRDDQPLKQELERVIASHRAEIDSLLRNFGVPLLAAR